MAKILKCYEVREPGRSAWVQNVSLAQALRARKEACKFGQSGANIYYVSPIGERDMVDPNGDFTPVKKPATPKKKPAAQKKMWKVFNHRSGYFFGEYPGSSDEAAIGAMLNDAGEEATKTKIEESRRQGVRATPA